MIPISPVPLGWPPDEQGSASSSIIAGTIPIAWRLVRAGSAWRGLASCMMERGRISTRAAGLPKARPSAGSAYWWIERETIGIRASAMRLDSAPRLGVGAVIDVSGNDSYECGGRYPSAYNAADAPDAQPHDAGYQFDCFGLGTGSGLRVFTKNPAQRALSLAGGWGLLVDLDGHDRYRSANFSQGHGYFFGLGVKLDLNGDDDHQAARYGHGTAAHFGVGLLIDYQGKDRYGSKGPFYNGGAAWDGSVALAIDGGMTSDFYDLPASTGLGHGRPWRMGTLH